jgi:cysteine synthase
VRLLVILAAAAAYAARAGIKAFVLIPEGKIAMGKMAQAMMYGAITMQIRGNFDDGMRLVKEVADQAPVTIVNSINPYRLQGQKTIAYEIVEALGRAPDYHCLPVGNAGNITAHWMGYTEAVANQPADQFEQVIYDAETDQFTGPKPEGLPTMVGYQLQVLRHSYVVHPLRTLKQLQRQSVLVIHKAGTMLKQWYVTLKVGSMNYKMLKSRSTAFTFYV